MDALFKSILNNSHSNKHLLKDNDSVDPTEDTSLVISKKEKKSMRKKSSKANQQIANSDNLLLQSEQTDNSNFEVQSGSNNQLLHHNDITNGTSHEIEQFAHKSKDIMESSSSEFIKKVKDIEHTLEDKIKDTDIPNETKAFKKKSSEQLKSFEEKLSNLLKKKKKAIDEHKPNTFDDLKKEGAEELKQLHIDLPKKESILSSFAGDMQNSMFVSTQRSRSRSKSSQRYSGRSSSVYESHEHDKHHQSRLQHQQQQDANMEHKGPHHDRIHKKRSRSLFGLSGGRRSRKDYVDVAPDTKPEPLPVVPHVDLNEPPLRKQLRLANAKNLQVPHPDKHYIETYVYAQRGNLPPKLKSTLREITQGELEILIKSQKWNVSGSSMHNHKMKQGKILTPALPLKLVQNPDGFKYDISHWFDIDSLKQYFLENQSQVSQLSVSRSLPSIVIKEAHTVSDVGMFKINNTVYPRGNNNLSKNRIVLEFNEFLQDNLQLSINHYGILVKHDDVEIPWDKIYFAFDDIIDAENLKASDVLPPLRYGVNKWGVDMSYFVGIEDNTSLTFSKDTNLPTEAIWSVAEVNKLDYHYTTVHKTGSDFVFHEEALLFLLLGEDPQSFIPFTKDDSTKKLTFNIKVNTLFAEQKTDTWIIVDPHVSEIKYNDSTDVAKKNYDVTLATGHSNPIYIYSGAPIFAANGVKLTVATNTDTRTLSKLAVPQSSYHSIKKGADVIAVIGRYLPIADAKSKLAIKFKTNCQLSCHNKVWSLDLDNANSKDLEITYIDSMDTLPTGDDKKQWKLITATSDITTTDTEFWIYFNGTNETPELASTTINSSNILSATIFPATGNIKVYKLIDKPAKTM